MKLEKVRSLFEELRTLTVERLDIAYLDECHNLLATASFTDNSLDRAAPPLRILIGKALSMEATAMIIAHNHPSGIAKPSPRDCAFTRTLCRLGGALDIQLIDHLILAGPSQFRFREAGLL